MKRVFRACAAGAASAVLFGNVCTVCGQANTAKPIPKTDPLEAEMRVVEPVAIGHHKQLFIDRYIIAKTDGVELTVTEPKRSPDNPCFCPDSDSDEGHGMIPDTVLYDRSRKLFRMWYTSMEGNADDQYPAYAESKDGIHWTRPSLNIRKFNGSTANNLMNGDPGVVIYDTHDMDPARRYKRIFTVENSGGVGVGVAFSPDGLHWTNSSANPVLNHTGDTHSWLGWDERSQRYIGYFRPHGERQDVLVREQKRRIGVSFSADAVHWTPIEPIIESDAHDPPGTEFYWLHAIPYEDVYVGLLSVLHMDNNLLDFRQPDPVGREQTVDMELVVSRDGVHWLRANNRAAWLPLGRFQSWDDLTMWPSAPVVLDDEIRVYYSGWNLRHHLDDLSWSDKTRDGLWRVSCIGFASLRLDGWVAAHAVAHRSGTLVTRMLTFEGNSLEVNADAARGHLKVELLNAAGDPIPGFSGPDAANITSDSLHQKVVFAKPLPHIPVRIKFTLQDAELYAFQFTD
ncbi:MAG TPA: hypothetical protein VG844_18475 [Terracidiphilus sp.]|nr:hypothetical protein [Terracidiphilus sp.]